jgi:hypothetical protein
LYAALEPDEVRHHRTARGMRAFAEDLGIYLPERNDPHETPCHDRPDVMMGDIIPFEAAASQTTLAREAEGRRGYLPLAMQAGV